jgi:hypothetical protein
VSQSELHFVHQIYPPESSSHSDPLGEDAIHRELVAEDRNQLRQANRIKSLLLQSMLSSSGRFRSRTQDSLHRPAKFVRPSVAMNYAFACAFACAAACSRNRVELVASRAPASSGHASAPVPEAGSSPSALADTSTSTVTSSTVPPSAAPGSCEGLRERFFALYDASRACATAGECACVSRLDVSGADSLIAVRASASGKLDALAAEYVARGCHVGSRAGLMPQCSPHCASGTCVP